MVGHDYDYRVLFAFGGSCSSWQYQVVEAYAFIKTTSCVGSP